MFGVLIWNDMPFALSVERKWQQNQRGISCIPEGTYECKRCRTSPDYDFKDSPKFGDTFQVMDVPDRSNILFHKGNIDDDTHGCIIVGESFDVMFDKVAVKASKEGFNEFKQLTEGFDTFVLSVENRF